MQAIFIHSFHPYNSNINIRKDESIYEPEENVKTAFCKRDETKLGTVLACLNTTCVFDYFQIHTYVGSTDCVP